MPDADPDRTAPLTVEGAVYDRCYYADYGGQRYERNAAWLEYFDRIAQRILLDIAPRRVLDAGCALGLLVESLRARGAEAYGIDFSPFAIEHVHDPVKPFCRLASVTDTLEEEFDLILCFEVLEHLTSAEGEAAIANLCGHAPDILFSSSPTHFRETTHLNSQPPEYWAALFARHGFYRDVDFDASFVASWAARFRRRTDPPHRIVADYERAFARVVMERNELRALALDMQGRVSGLSLQRDEAESARSATRAELERVTQQLAEARDTTAAMQRSWFWRIRRPWEWVSRLLGR